MSWKVFQLILQIIITSISHSFTFDWEMHCRIAITGWVNPFRQPSLSTTHRMIQHYTWTQWSRSFVKLTWITSKSPVCTLQRTQCFSNIQTKLLMMLRENNQCIVSIRCIHEVVCGQSVEKCSYQLECCSTLTTALRLARRNFNLPINFKCSHKRTSQQRPRYIRLAVSDSCREGLFALS